jgi:signal peptidase I
MLKVLKVTGASLSPTFREGDFVIVAKIPFFINKINPGDIVVFNHHDYGIMIKRVERVVPEKDEVYVIGTRGDSLDSRLFGPINQKTVIGKVIWHIKKP